MSDLMAWLGEKIDNIIKWFGDLFVAIFKAFIDLMLDIFTLLADMVFTVIYHVFQVLELPAFIADGIGALFSGFPDWLQFFLSVTGFSQALALVGLGVGFNLLRKLGTLGQW